MLLLCFSDICIYCKRPDKNMRCGREPHVSSEHYGRERSWSIWLLFFFFHIFVISQYHDSSSSFFHSLSTPCICCWKSATYPSMAPTSSTACGPVIFFMTWLATCFGWPLCGKCSATGVAWRLVFGVRNWCPPSAAIGVVRLSSLRESAAAS